MQQLCGTWSLLDFFAVVKPGSPVLHCLGSKRNHGFPRVLQKQPREAKARKIEGRLEHKTKSWQDNLCENSRASNHSSSQIIFIEIAGPLELLWMSFLAVTKA